MSQNKPVALAEGYERRAEKASYADAAKALARSAGRADPDESSAVCC
jgi:hypothetical protein